MIQQERRVSKRKPLASLAYISIPPDNGGIVLDLSEGGIGFHTVVPVDRTGRIPFRFSMDSISGIEAVGELAWRDESGRTGGLRFVELPSGIREVIREWAGEETSLAAIAAAAPQPVVVRESISPAAPESDATGQSAQVEIAESVTRAEDLLPKIPETEIAAPAASVEDASPELQIAIASLELLAEVAAPEVKISPGIAVEIPVPPMEIGNSLQPAIEIPMSPVADDLFIEEILEERIAPAESEAREPIVGEAPVPAAAEGLRAAPYTAPDYSLSMFPSEMVYQEMAERAARPPIHVRHPFAAIGAMIVAASVIGAGVFGIVTAGGLGAEFLQWVHRVWYLMHNF